MKTLLTSVKPRFKSRTIRPKRLAKMTLVISEISTTLYRLQQTTLVLHKNTKDKKILEISTKLSFLLPMNSKLRQNRPKTILTLAKSTTHSQLKLTRTTRVKMLTIMRKCLMTKSLKNKSSHRRKMNKLQTNLVTLEALMTSQSHRKVKLPKTSMTNHRKMMTLVTLATSMNQISSK